MEQLYPKSSFLFLFSQLMNKLKNVIWHTFISLQPTPSLPPTKNDILDCVILFDHVMTYFIIRDILKLIYLFL